MRITAFVLGGLFLFPGLLSANGGQTVIVLDASNSMWGQIEGVNKVTLARDGLTGLLGKQPTQNNLGLITYGNRRKSDCADISVAAKPGELDTPSLLQQINSTRPYGRSPISAALQQAAETLGGSGQILLVSDGPDSCNGDPCAVAKQLKAKQPELQIHVLSFQPDDATALRCVADNTGGKFALIQDAQSLSASLFNAGENLASSKNKNAAVENLPPDDTPGTLRLTAGATGGDDTQPANFLIYDHDGNHVASFTARNTVTQSLPPGDYQISMLWRSSKLTQKVTLTPGQTIDHRFDLGPMGILQLQATDAQQQPVDANFTLYAPNDDYLGEYLLKPGITETLPAGTYRVKANAGTESQETSLEITANGETSHVFRFRTLSAQQ